MVALHRRGSSQCGVKGGSKSSGTALAWAVLSRFIGVRSRRERATEERDAVNVWRKGSPRRAERLLIELLFLTSLACALGESALPCSSFAPHWCALPDTFSFACVLIYSVPADV